MYWCWGPDPTLLGNPNAPVSPWSRFTSAFCLHPWGQLISPGLTTHHVWSPSVVADLQDGPLEILSSWYLCPCITPIHIELWLVCVTNRMLQKWRCVPSEARWWKTLHFYHTVLGSLTLEETSCHIVRTFKQPYGGFLTRKNWDLLPTASTDLPSSWVSHLGNRSSRSR